MRSFVVFTVVVTLFIFSACSSEFEPKAYIYASTDNGNSYTSIEGETLKVGETFYLKFDVSIKAGLLTESEIPFSIAIPSNDSFRSTLVDTNGSTNPIPVDGENIQRYDFVAHAKSDPETMTVIFQGKALNTAKQHIKISYGGNVAEKYSQDFYLFFTQNKGTSKY